jgi:hypothetical protein
LITGAHFLLYSTDAPADRAFFRDVLGFRAVDAGGGWLILGLPPAELGVHPGDGSFSQKHADHSMLGVLLYLMCDDLPATMSELAAKGVNCSGIVEAEWGRTTTVPLPSGGVIGLYQPLHPTAI